MTLDMHDITDDIIICDIYIYIIYPVLKGHTSTQPLTTRSFNKLYCLRLTSVQHSKFTLSRSHLASLLYKLE